MPHIDEPLLQAYVDGFCSEARVAEIEKHLSSCAACVARLAGARSAAARASELLGALEPGPMHAPSFEDLKERAAGAPADAARVMEALEKARAATASAEPAKRDRSVLRSPVLAWAATIVIAFAVGWMSRGGAGSEPVAVRGPAGVAEPRLQTPAAELADALPDSPVPASTARDQASPADDAAEPESSTAGERVAEQAVAPPDVGAAAAVVPDEATANVGAPAEPMAASGSFPIRSVDAEVWLGAPLRTLPDLGLQSVEVVPAALLDDALPGRVGVRVIYRTATGEEVALLQQYYGAGRQLSLVDAAAGLRAEAARAATTDEAVARLRVADNDARRAEVEMALDAAFLDALDLPTTVRDPDGHVTHTWSEGGYLLRISGALDADSVRSLAAGVR